MAPSSNSKNSKSKQPVHNVQKTSMKGAKPKTPIALKAEDDVPDFPRGRGSSSTRDEADEIKSAGDKDHRMLKRKNNKDRRGQNRNPSSEHDDLGSLFGDGIVGKLPRFANKITLKNIGSGMKLWGVIAEINEKDIEVSLPGGLRGLVRASEAFDPILDNDGVEHNFLSKVYHVGQLVSCIVLQVDDNQKEIAKRKIWLSLRLSLLHQNLTLDSIQEGMVLSAYVKSVEDRGFVLHFGLTSFYGFMAKHNQFEKANVEVSECQVLQGVVKSVDKVRKVVLLSADAGMVSNSLTKNLMGISIDLLVPGMMVNARVHSTLENGIMLSFLTYFTGTVDLFNLDKTFPTPNWKADYSKNLEFTARILFIDPSTRAVGLTLNPSLVRNKAPLTLVKVGDIFDQSKVIRVDKGSGLLLEIPTSPNPTPAFVNVSDVADKEVQKLEKSFKEGSLHRVRVLGYRHLEGLATGILKTSAIEGLVFTHSDVKPGMIVKAKVVTVDSTGAIVQLASGLKAKCPLRHMSEHEITKPKNKTFKVGVELNFRVLGCKSKRITVTRKRTLVNSKLTILGSYADATEGLVAHGWITKIENHGCFVRFYNGVQGFVPRSELGLHPGSDIASMYHVEQVVKCRVLNCIPASHRINLSFNMTPIRASEEETAKFGSIVSGVIAQITARTIIVNVNSSSYMKGTISLEHLADHHGLAASLMSSLKPGYHFDELLVLDTEGHNLVLTAKYSLIKSAEQLPIDCSHIEPHSVVHGYVCNIIETGCFVRFIGRLTGFAPKSKATDVLSSDLSEVFYIGQSVRSNILDVDRTKGRIKLSLKQSLCCSTDASFIQDYFLLEEKIAKLQQPDSGADGPGWIDGFGIGTVVEGKVHEIKDFGVVISFQKYADVYGFISHYQLAKLTVKCNSLIQAAVLDFSKVDRLVDLSVKPEFTNSSSKEEISSLKTLKKKRKREARKDLEVNQVVTAIVEIVKENYLVLSLPAYNHTLGYASVIDYNTQKLPPNKFTHGQSVTATVICLPAPSTCGRLLLLLKSLSSSLETSSSKRAKKNSSYDVGSLVQAEITEIKPLELRLKFGFGLQGRIYVTEANDDNSAESPFNNYKIGQTLTARIVSKGSKPESNKGTYRWELSIKPSLLRESNEVSCLPASTEDFNYSLGQHVSGFVYKIDSQWAWLSISRDVKAQLYVLDISSEPSELADFEKQYYVGKALSGFIIGVNSEKKLLRVALHPVDVGTLEHNENHPARPSVCHIVKGSFVGGRISKILPGVGGLLVQVDPHLHGRVHFTELANSWVPNPLSGYQEGQLVKCKVLEVNHAVRGTVHIDLSLRLPSDNSHHLSSVMPASDHRVYKIKDLHPNMVVQGYVKNVSSKGCFIMLSRNIDAKILLSNLSDSFVKNLENEFPVGRLVTGKVLTVEPMSKRVEVTLKTSSAISVPKSDTDFVDSVIVGETISGRIKRVESYGLFISITHTNVVGLCHISELSDDHVDDIETKFKAGDEVVAKVLKVDKDRNRVSLGMKSSYFEDEVSQIPMSQPSDIDMGSKDAGIVANDFDNGCIFTEVESRAVVPPLEVHLDDLDCFDIGNDVGQTVANTTETGTVEVKNIRRLKKKAQEEREREIRAAEEGQLENGAPKTADDYEKLIKNSPNNSFLWIKYMAFMLSLADLEKARSIAERALATINMREEDEKLHIWVAYINLENEYGSPPEEAVKKLFQRALQYCDPKKLHLALLEVYERTEKHELANELFEKMNRKFKRSCKVWLRRVEYLLEQKNDEIQSVVNRALICLPKEKHIKFISHCGILEFKSGVPDRGRSMFEGMLREYPKRTNLWSMYLDQEIRLGETDVIRALFERATSLSLAAKKMKFLFKKYLEYEKSIGDESKVEYVKKKAMDYVESALA